MSALPRPSASSARKSLRRSAFVTTAVPDDEFFSPAAGKRHSTRHGNLVVAGRFRAVLSVPGEYPLDQLNDATREVLVDATLILCSTLPNVVVASQLVMAG